MIVGLEFLSSINEKIICVNDGERIEFTCGEEARKYYSDAPGVYSVKRIMIENGVIVVILKHEERFFCE